MLADPEADRVDGQREEVLQVGPLVLVLARILQADANLVHTGEKERERLKKQSIKVFFTGLNPSN